MIPDDPSGQTFADAAHAAGAVAPVVVVPSFDVSVQIVYRGARDDVKRLVSWIEDEVAATVGVVNVVAGWSERPVAGTEAR